MSTPRITDYPLCWPEGWARTSAAARQGGYQFKQFEDQRSSFGDHVYKAGRLVTVQKARRKLLDEIGRMKGVSDVVVSTNLKRQSDAEIGRIGDPGVAVWFKLVGRGMVMAVDRFDNVAANMRSVGLAIEAMRQLERHGGGVMMERAFTGFAALPPPPSPWEILGVEKGAGVAEIEAAFRAAALKHHPDRGGATAKMAELNVAREQALREAAP
jgi:hypothetical protein